MIPPSLRSTASLTSSSPTGSSSSTVSAGRPPSSLPLFTPLPESLPNGFAVHHISLVSSRSSPFSQPTRCVAAAGKVLRPPVEKRPCPPLNRSLRHPLEISSMQQQVVNWTVLQGSVTIGTKNSLTNGTVALKPYQNGVADKPANGAAKGHFYSNGNGVHV